MDERYKRTEMLIGEEKLNILRNSKIAVFGVGGVGGYVVEGLARCGVGNIDIFDNDVVALSNINRQIIATSSTVGKQKVEVMKQRINDIDESIKVNAYNLFFSSENSSTIDFSTYDYVVDAIDSVKSKIELIVKCKQSKTPIISSMGTGNKLNPTEFKIADIKKTSVCPLAKVIRRELKNLGIENLKVLYSEELPKKPKVCDGEKSSPASISFVPSVAGLIIAGEVVKDLIKE